MILVIGGHDAESCPTTNNEQHLFQFRVQLGQRVALMGMTVKQCGHSLVVGSATSGCGLFLQVVDALDHQEDDQGDNDEINEVVDEIAVSDFGAAEGEGRPLKSIPPMIRPIKGIMMSVNQDETILPNAPR